MTLVALGVGEGIVAGVKKPETELMPPLPVTLHVPPAGDPAYVKVDDSQSSFDAGADVMLTLGSIVIVIEFVVQPP